MTEDAVQELKDGDEFQEGDPYLTIRHPLRLLKRQGGILTMRLPRG